MSGTRSQNREIQRSRSVVKIWKLSNLVLEWIGGEARVEGNCYGEFVCSMLYEENHWSHFGVRCNL